jgi:hypothetical protein
MIAGEMLERAPYEVVIRLAADDIAALAIDDQGHNSSFPSSGLWRMNRGAMLEQRWFPPVGRASNYAGGLSLSSAVAVSRVR